MKFKLLFFLLISKSVTAQTSFKNLVFEGAGIRGVAYAGVLAEMEKNNLLKQVEKTGGTSAGSIVALAIALGYNAGEIKDIVANTNFGSFSDGQYLFFGGIHRMRKNYGWYKGDSFDAWLQKIIKAKTSSPEITFREMHARGYKDLYVTATCLNKQKQLVFSYETYPEMKVKDAIRISMSVPLYFEAIFIDSVGHVIKNPLPAQKTDLVVDGGIAGNFPIALFDETIIDAHKNKIRKANPLTIGVRIDSEKQIVSDKTTHELIPQKINGIKSYLEAFYIYTLENLNRNTLTQEDWDRTISVADAGIGPKVKQLTEAQKNALMKNGENSVKEFMKQKNKL